METFEKMCGRVVGGPHFIKNAAIGCLLAHIPIVNFLCLGYLMKFGQRPADGAIVTPAWFPPAEWRRCIADDFIGGLWTALGFIVTVGVPAALFWAILLPLRSGDLGLCLGLFLGIPAFACAVVGESGWRTVDVGVVHRSISTFRSAYGMAVAHWRTMIVPSALFLLLQMVSSLLLPPICLGATIFFGLLFLVPRARQTIGSDGCE
jgi:hypothetical protein